MEGRSDIMEGMKDFEPMLIQADPRRPYDIAYDLRMSAPPPPMFGLCLETPLPHFLARLEALGFKLPTA